MLQALGLALTPVGSAHTGSTMTTWHTPLVLCCQHSIEANAVPLRTLRSFSLGSRKVLELRGGRKQKTVEEAGERTILCLSPGLEKDWLPSLSSLPWSYEWTLWLPFVFIKLSGEAGRAGGGGPYKEGGEFGKQEVPWAIPSQQQMWMDSSSKCQAQGQGLSRLFSLLILTANYKRQLLLAHFVNKQAKVT